jgi:hypothetical protein
MYRACTSEGMFQEGSSESVSKGKFEAHLEVKTLALVVLGYAKGRERDDDAALQALVLLTIRFVWLILKGLSSGNLGPVHLSLRLLFQRLRMTKNICLDNYWDLGS